MRMHDFIDGSVIKRPKKVHMILLVPMVKISILNYSAIVSDNVTDRGASRRI